MLLGALLILITIVAYAPAFQAGYIWDDDDYVYNNPNLRTFAGLGEIWLAPQSSPQYYPLVHSMFWLEYRLWGLAPQGFHAVNILLHAANAVLLWRVLLRLQAPGAWLAAAVFALHPVHVESVAWITERKNTLSGFFYLAAALLFLRAILQTQRLGIGWYAGALVCFFAAMLCKTVTATLPAALLLLLWWKRGRITRRDLAATAPMFLVAIPWGLLTAWLEKHHVGAMGADWSYSWLDRLLIASRALWFYAAKLVWPAELTFIYPKWRIDDRAWWQYLFALAAISVPIALWAMRKRIGRDWLAGVLFFAGTLFPALGFFNVYPMRYSFVADHFQYLASIGLIALAAGAAAAWHVRRPARWHLIVAALILTALVGLTWRQCLIYRDAPTLWRDTLAKNPKCTMAHTNLGLDLRDSGQLDEAETHLRAALALAPEDPETHHNLASVLIDLGRFDEAYDQATHALQHKPNHAEARMNLGLVLRRRGLLDEAEAEFRRAAQLDPTRVRLRYNLALILHERNQLEAARHEYLAAIALAPEFIPARSNLAILLMEQGDHRGAIAQLETVLKIDPERTETRELLQSAREAAKRATLGPLAP